MYKKTRCSFAAVACMFFSLLLLPVGVCEGRDRELPAGAGAGHYEGTIVAFGDSLTKGHKIPRDMAYPAQLERKLRLAGYSYRVINSGIGGEKSEGALSRVDSILSYKPDIVILETGINDGHRNIEIGIIERNINEIVRILKENNVTVVLAGMRVVKNQTEEYANAFKRIYPRVAEKQGVILVPYFQDGVAGDPALIYPDRVHTTARGDQVVMQNVYPYVIEAIKKVETTRKRKSRRPADSVRKDSPAPERRPVPGSYQKSPALSPSPSGP